MLRTTRLALAAGAAFLAAAHFAAPTPARADIPGNKIRLGVLTDLNGNGADSTGTGSVVSARLAAEDFKKAHPGIEVEVISLDHQNKPDVGSAAARKWVADGTVDAILDVPFSSVALAVQEVVRGTNVAFIASGPGTALLTGEKCSPNSVHWTYDTWALAHGTAAALLKAKKDTWFFVTADYAFGHALEADAMAVVKAAPDGKVLGSVRHPPNASDFSSFILQAQASGAQVVALANAVGDTINSVKAAAEFGLTQKQSLAALLMQVTDVHSLGLPVAKGLFLTEGFYWNMNDGTRAYADRFAAQMNGRRPTANQAGVYSGALHYLRAAAAANTTEGQKVVAKMKEMPSDDPLFGKGEVRPDGRHIHNMYLFQVKTPDQSKGPWDYYNLVETIPAKDAFRPMAEGKCPMVKG